MLTLTGKLSQGYSVGFRPVVGPDGWVLFDWYREDLGVEPWVTDGTPGGTRPLGDLCPGECESRPAGSAGKNYLISGGFALFSARDSESGREPWVTDGTPAGTRRLTDACPGPCDGFPSRLRARVVPEGVLFSVHREAGGSLLLADGPASLRTVLDSDVAGLLDALPWPGSPDLLLLLDAAGSGFEPWRSDLTAAGTKLIRNIHPGHDPGSHPRPAAHAAGSLFLVSDPQTGAPPRLWTTDGTPAGTRPLAGLPVPVEAALPGSQSIWAGTSRHLFVLFPDADTLNKSLSAWVLDVGAGRWSESPRSHPVAR